MLLMKNNFIIEICSDSFTKGVIIGVVAGVLAGIILSVVLWLFRKFFETAFIEPIKTFKENRKIRMLLLSRSYYLIFEPTSGKRKLINFGNNGEITDGQNKNEHTWKVAKRKLEIYGSDKVIFSRFIYNHKSGKFENSNDPDTRSIQNQIIEPQWKKV